jgi:hypothetical protein
MVSNAIAASIILVVGVAFWFYNKPISHHIANSFASAFKPILPEKVRPEELFYIFYRVFFYVASLFCFACFALFLIFAISNIV